MNFSDILARAKAGENEAISIMLERYKSLLLRNAILDGKLDEDLYQELCIIFLRCIKLF